MKNATEPTKLQACSPRWDSNLQPLYAKPGFADNLVVQTDLQRYLYFHLKPRLAPNVFRIYTYYLLAMPSVDFIEAWDAHFVSRLAKGASGKTLNNELGVFKGYLRWLKSRGHFVPDVLLSYPHFRHVPKKFRRALTAEEISRLRTVSGPRWAWWSFLLHTGLRKSEFEGLTWHDVLDGSIMVTDAKNPLKQRIVPLHPEAMGLLRFARNDKVAARNDKEGRLFSLPRRACSLLRIFKRDLARAGISQEIDLHCLRVTFVSALARAGVSPRTAQELAGHSDIRTTLKIYTKVTDRDKVDAVNRLKF